MTTSTTIAVDRLLTVVVDRITRDQLWCGGFWPTPLLAEMGAARR